MSSFPNDADGDALRRVEDAGADMSRVMEIDFHIAIPDKRAGEQIAVDAISMGYSTKIWQDEEDGEWTLECSKAMHATYDGVVNCQNELEEIARPFNGYTDGWGTFGNTQQ